MELERADFCGYKAPRYLIWGKCGGPKYSSKAKTRENDVMVVALLQRIYSHFNTRRARIFSGSVGYEARTCRFLWLSSSFICRLRKKVNHQNVAASHLIRKHSLLLNSDFILRVFYKENREKYQKYSKTNRRRALRARPIQCRKVLGGKKFPFYHKNTPKIGFRRD